MHRSLIILFVAVAMPLAEPALAQDRGCDIETTSYVRIVPKDAPKSDTVIATPQTPCPVLDTGPQPQIGPITIDIKPPKRKPAAPQTGQAREP